MCLRVIDLRRPEANRTQTLARSLVSHLNEANQLNNLRATPRRSTPAMYGN